MRWIQRGRQLGRAVKNVQRLRQIVSVFAKHGYDDVVERMNLGKFLPSRWTKLATDSPGENKTPPELLKECFEELGPTFVKLGQLLSTRPDLVPDAYIEEFTKLQDDVAPLGFNVIQEAVERELQGPLGKYFREFDHEPLASASIAQVHRATLHNGDEVVVKVQRPGIEKIIKTDISLLAFLARLLERYIPEIRIYNPELIVDEFFRTLSYELDFVVEANNIRKFSKNMESLPEIVIPKIYKDLSTSKILTLERLVGIRVNDSKALDRAKIDRKKVVEAGARAFFRSVMIDGLFHGDLHGGNLFVLPNNKIGMIDFGIVGRLSQKARDRLADMMITLINEDYENLCYQYAELGAADPTIDFDNFQREVRNAVSPYLGLNISEVNSGKVLIDSTKIAAKYQIRLPSEWMLVFKAIFTMEGMGRTLDPNFDLMSIGQELAKELTKNQYSPSRISKDLLWMSKDVLTLLQVLPRQIRWMFKKFNRNDFALEIRSPELSQLKEQLETNSKRTSLSILVSGLFIASAIALQFSAGQSVLGLPALAFTYGAIGVLLLLRLFIF